MSERGGFIGIFFVAFTLAIVSFSCTGPIIGSLLVEAAKQGNRIGPMVGMFGFALALAIPFTIFAIFPSLMRTLPKSGGWLNSVKIVFGFLELALAFKFFSNVDMSYHWELFKREYFLIIWIIISAMLGFYLLGKLRFHHDSPVQYITIPRLFLSIIFLGLAMYMTTGLFGAPLNMLSGLQPPVEYSEWRQSGVHYPDNDAIEDAIGYTPLDLPVYFNYDQALAKAKQYKKPLMIDFTGFNCANCRKMEQNVWSDNSVLAILKKDYIIVSLHTDDKRKLPKEKVYTTKEGKEINNLGRKWSDLEISRYGASTQPLYVLLDHNEEKLNEPVSVCSVSDFQKFLVTGKEEFAKRNKH
jgi:thiol:disulfide interchange protein DsbD